jgi:hypothetical protein
MSFWHQVYLLAFVSVYDDRAPVTYEEDHLFTPHLPIYAFGYMGPISLLGKSTCRYIRDTNESVI